MPIIRTSKTSKKIEQKPTKKESSYEKMKRIHQEKEENEHRILDRQRRDKEHKLKNIIIPYLETVVQHLIQKKLGSFWAWPDRAGFKKINSTTYDQMKKLAKSDKKYHNRIIAHFQLFTGHSNKYAVADDLWMAVDMTMFHIDENGVLDADDAPSWGCKIIWEYDDFKVSKLSFRLLEELMRIVAAKKHRCESLAGYRLAKVVDALKKKKIDISAYLQPLAGA